MSFPRENDLQGALAPAREKGLVLRELDMRCGAYNTETSAICFIPKRLKNMGQRLGTDSQIAPRRSTKNRAPRLQGQKPFDENAPAYLM